MHIRRLSGKETVAVYVPETRRTCWAMGKTGATSSSRLRFVPPFVKRHREASKQWLSNVSRSMVMSSCYDDKVPGDIVECLQGKFSLCSTSSTLSLTLSLSGVYKGTLQKAHTWRKTKTKKRALQVTKREWCHNCEPVWPSGKALGW